MFHQSCSSLAPHPHRAALLLCLPLPLREEMGAQGGGTTWGEPRRPGDTARGATIHVLGGLVGRACGRSALSVLWASLPFWTSICRRCFSNAASSRCFSAASVPRITVSVQPRVLYAPSSCIMQCNPRGRKHMFAGSLPDNYEMGDSASTACSQLRELCLLEESFFCWRRAVPYVCWWTSSGKAFPPNPAGHACPPGPAPLSAPFSAIVTRQLRFLRCSGAAEEGGSAPLSSVENARRLFLLGEGEEGDALGLFLGTSSHVVAALVISQTV